MLIQDLQIVLKVAEFRSITAAATSLNLQAATASAAVKRVEQALGFELFVRSTRQLRLSSAGERYLPQCEQALQLLDNAKNQQQIAGESISGELRIGLSSDLGRNIVMPWLDAFLQKHPQVSLKAHISDSNIDFYRDPVDIALRYGSPKDSNLYGFKICDIPAVVCATPDYLAKHGTPQHPHQLAEHNGLFYQLQDKIYNLWEFENLASPTANREKIKVKMNGNRAGNDGDLVRRWCVAGHGIAVKSSLDLSADLLAGNVVPILQNYKARTTELWLICPSRQLITPAIRLLRDDLKEKCQQVFSQLADKNLLPKS
ncbi:LysR family transcriptional regulator [Catenovulum sp. SX2]|uniref:LysR family transcriptional regulator n=1 Tax=Catenovulum sp. SX2 TaxID=3398614 RepID=UPI003F83EC59